MHFFRSNYPDGKLPEPKKFPEEIFNRGLKEYLKECVHLE
jgi:hypothetical protein